MQLRHLVAVATAIAILLLGILRPAYNFDIVGYVGTAHYKQGLRGAALAERTFADVKAEIGAARLAQLMGSPYGETVLRDPVSLEQQLPFYTIRQGYVSLMEGLHRVGVDYARASYLISAVFQAIAVLLLGAIAARAGVSPWALPGVALISSFVELAQLSTPDAMACMLALAATLLGLRRSPWALAVAAVVPFVRTDYALFSVLLSGAYFLQGRRGPAVLGLVAAVAAYVLNNALNGGYGYLTVFQFTLVGLDPYPASMAISTDPATYAKVYLRLVKSLAWAPHVVVYFIALCVALSSLGGARPSDDERLMRLLLLIVPMAFVVSHLLLLPIYTARYFAYPVSVMLVWVLATAARGGVGVVRARY